MNTKKWITVFLNLAILLTCHCSASNEEILNHLNANNDHGFWLEQSTEKKLSDYWSLRFDAELRWGSDYRKLWYQTYRPIIYLNIAKLFGIKTNSFFESLNVGVGYEANYLIAKDTTGKFNWVYINKPLAECNLVLSWGGWKIKQRMKEEWHRYTKHHYLDHTLYRHRLAFFTPWKFTSWKINPYVSNEWFFRKDTFCKKTSKGLVGGWYQNRFRAGVLSELIKDRLSVFLFWQWVADKKPPGTRPRWFNYYHYGLDMAFSF